MASTNKWKFIHNGEGWWLRIDNIDDLLRYIKAIESSFAEALITVIEHNNANKIDHFTNDLAGIIDSLASIKHKSALNTTNKLFIDACITYVKLLSKNGFVNINSKGGCNSLNYIAKIIKYNEKLIFPQYSEKDIIIKTWEAEDKKLSNFCTNHKYHYYAYIGDIQIKDNNKEKWDTYEDAYEFAKQFIQ